MHKFLKIIFGIKLYIFQQFLCPSLACEQDQDGTSSVLILLAKMSANLYDIYHCCVYSEILLMMDRGTVRIMQSFIPKINLRN